MQTRTKQIIFGVVSMIAIAGSTTACSQYNDERGKGDAPVYQHHGDDSPAFVTNMPDGFGNISAKCIFGFPGMAVASNTKKIQIPFPYAGCDGKGNPPNVSIGVGN
jgi:hypothetical protein